MQTLSTGQLNRTVLARQLLLERQSLSIRAALERLGGIQNQYAPNAYIRLWSCLTGFRRAELDRSYESGEAVQGTLMRGTIHTVAAPDYHPFAAAIREPQRAWARRVHKSDDTGRDEVIERVRQALAGRAVKRPEFLALLEGVDRSISQTVMTDAEIVRVPPSGTWDQRRAHLYGLADDHIEHQEVEASAARAHLVRRYLAGFGPASASDISAFCGIPAATLRPTIEQLELRTFADETGATLLDVPDAPLLPADAPAAVRFLPTWDALLLVHARRTGILPEQYRPFLFSSKTPQSFATFLVDGRVAGTWRWNAEAGRIDLAPFEALPKAAITQLEDEAERLAELHG